MDWSISEQSISQVPWKELIGSCLTATVVIGKNNMVTKVIAFIVLLSFLIMKLSPCVTVLNACIRLSIVGFLLMQTLYLQD